MSKGISNHFSVLWASDVINCHYSENIGLEEKILVLKTFHSHTRDKVREEREREGGVSLYYCGLTFVLTSKT
jgi:hypothetical protein